MLMGWRPNLRRGALLDAREDLRATEPGASTAAPAARAPSRSDPE